MFKHLVFSGGGPIFLKYIGMIKTLKQQLQIENIYGTSAGALMSLLCCLKLDWDLIETYFIERPWNQLFNKTLFQEKQGLYDISIMTECLRPLFLASSLPLEITLQELYNYSNICLHVIVHEVNNYSSESISYKTHPHLSVIEAIYMSCSLPFLFTPTYLNNKCYIDGGTLMNYPLTYCIQDGHDKTHILGFHYKGTLQLKSSTPEMSLIEHLQVLCNNALAHHVRQPIIDIPHEIHINDDMMDIMFIYNCLNDVNSRKKLVEEGTSDPQLSSFLKIAF